MAPSFPNRQLGQQGLEASSELPWSNKPLTIDEKSMLLEVHARSIHGGSILLKLVTYWHSRGIDSGEISFHLSVPECKTKDTEKKEEVKTDTWKLIKKNQGKRESIETTQNTYENKQRERQKKSRREKNNRKRKKTTPQLKERRKRKRQKVQDTDLQETEWKETGKGQYTSRSNRL